MKIWLKRMLAVLLLPLLLVLTGCTGKALPRETVLLCSFYPMYIATLNVAAGIPGVRVENLTGPQTGCLHDYQLTPRDLRRIAQARIFVANGAGMESFLDRALRQNPTLKIVEASRGIPLIRGAGKEGDNPHVWVSVAAAAAQARNIGEGLAAADPVHAAAYRKNAAAYAARLEDLERRMHHELDGLPHRDIVTFHEAFPYFAREFRLRIVAVVEREPGSEPSAAELAATIDTVRHHVGAALFTEPQYPARAAEAVARETGTRLWALDPAVTGPNDPDAYLAIMERNLKVLCSALGNL